MKVLTTKLLFITLLCSFLGNAQIHYEIHTAFGFSNLKITNWEKQYVIGNTYDYAPAYTIGAMMIKPLHNNMFRLQWGLELESLATKVGITSQFQPDEIDLYSGVERNYFLTIPLQFSYSFEKWLYLNVGVKNKFFLKNKKDNANTYTLGFNAGVDYILNEHYRIGAGYDRDITPFTKENGKEIYWYFQQFSIKLSYVFD